MVKSLQDWLQEGKALYDATVAEHQEMEEQLADLQERLIAKRTEANQLARMIGKPTLGGIASTNGNGKRRGAEGPAELAVEGSATTTATTEDAVEVSVVVMEPGQSAPYTLSSIARALTGKPTRR